MMLLVFVIFAEKIFIRTNQQNTSEREGEQKSGCTGVAREKGDDKK